MKVLILSLSMALTAASVANAKEKVVSRKPSQQSVGELSPDAAKVIGDLLRRAEQAGNRSVKFEGGPQVTVYSVGNLSCYFQNSDNSVTCGVGQ